MKPTSAERANRHASKRRQYQGTGAIGKIGVIGAIARRIRMRR